MSLIIEATYEDGVLKPAEPLPFKERDRVQIAIQPASSWTERTYGMLGWSGDHETLERILAEAEESEDSV